LDGSNSMAAIQQSGSAACLRSGVNPGHPVLGARDVQPACGCHPYKALSMLSPGSPVSRNEITSIVSCSVSKPMALLSVMELPIGTGLCRPRLSVVGRTTPLIDRD
jgi:hypothetical protein